MKKITLLLAGICLVLQAGYGRTVTGLVTSKDDGEPIIGASIMVKGTTNGTITNIDGNYTIEAADGATLVFSYIGMKKVEHKVTAEILNVIMQSDAIAVEEVVVTAMGVVQEKKKMNFAVQSVGSEEITQARESNAALSLQGRVAGVNISTSGGSPNAGARMQIRGISSINSSQGNEPLFVIDGIQVAGGAAKLADINPNDIENITVLKGAAASALYGSDASNGVVMVTTKKGQKGKVTINANANVQIDNAVRVPKIQRLYNSGSNGFYKTETTGGWGPLVSSDQTVYDNVGDFLSTGISQKYDLSASGGTDNFSGYASVGYSKANGIVPSDYLNKMNILLKGSYTIKNVTLAGQMTLSNSQSRSFGNNMGSVYAWPIVDQMSNFKNDDGSIRWLEIYDTKINSVMNPYWERYEDQGRTDQTRNLMQGSINWKAFKNFEITGRAALDQTFTQSLSSTTPRFSESDFIQDEAFKSDPNYIGNIPTKYFGAFNYDQSRSSRITAQAIANYKIELPKEFTIDLMAGTEMQIRKSLESSLGGRKFIIPGDFYSQQNIEEVINGTDVSLYRSERRMYSFFGEIRADYKGLAHISVTGRQDASSTLDPKNNKFFYPSVTGGLIFSELFNISNDWFSYGKLRGNYAKVGKDAAPYLFDRKFKPFPTYPDGGYGSDPTASVAQNLTPEMTSSWEIGVDLRFFDNKTRLDLAYYSTTVTDQIVTVRVSPASGNILQTRNEGAVKNHGVEFTIDQQILKNKDISWNATLNFGLNRSLVTHLPDQLTEIQGTQYGDIFPVAFLHGSTTALSGKDYMRNEEGKVICTADGVPVINPAKGNLIGNREPKFVAGLGSTFKYKDLTIGILFEGRLGGDVANITSRNLWSNGQARALEFYRNRQVIIDGVVEQADGSFVPNTTPVTLDQRFIGNYINSVSSNFIEDGSYLRLSNVSFTYDFSRLIKKQKTITGLSASLIGRNLFLLTKYSGSDPNINSSTSAGGTGSGGIDNYNIPNTRSFSFNVNISF